MTNQQFCVHLAKCYRAKSTDANDLAKVTTHNFYTFQEDGVTYYTVGRNSSHDFYLGVDANDNLYKRSIGEMANGISWEAYELMYETKTNPVTQDNIGYIGHW